jgi:4'-phosphopantetheinyl transferase
MRPRLVPGGVHIWMAELSGGGNWRYLSEQEQARARAVMSDRLRARFIAARSILRQLLGRYLGKAPDRIELRANAHGKPMLAGRQAALQFNLSHTDDLLLVAFARDRAVGIDVDRLDRVGDWAGVARSSFSNCERATLELLPESLRAKALMCGWIRKEAYAKARGAGYAYGFKLFSVRLDPVGRHPVLIRDDRDAAAAGRWWTADLAVRPPLGASLAVEGRPEAILCWRFKPARHSIECSQEVRP